MSFRHPVQGLSFRQNSLFTCMAFCLVFVVAPVLAEAANFKLVGQQVEITGEIGKGDGEKFRQLANDAKLPARTVVRLTSDGGLIVEAFVIGLEIRNRKFHTYAPEGLCASACGLTWLAGVERYKHPRGKIGFHHSFDGKTTRPQANALVGHYLAQLGYDWKTSLFVTKAKPAKLRWLTVSAAEEAGITFESRTIRRTEILSDRVPIPYFRPKSSHIEVGNGGRYSGEVWKGLPHGEGSMVWPNGDRYTGEWREGLRHGRGTFNYSNGNRYVGDWRQGRRSGKGIFYFADGRVYSGQWRQGLKDGVGTYAVGSDQIVKRYKSGFKLMPKASNR